MNHCILGGLGDGDGGEDGEEGGGGANGGTGDSFPATGIMGEHRPLAPFLHDFLGALPHGDGIHGGQKRGFVGCKFVGADLFHELGFLPLYSFSDSRHPILGCSKSGLAGPSSIRIS